jgi:predicted SAM-dependent methyltransferase
MASHLIFAADTLIRFKSGRMLIHTTSSALPAFETDNPMMVGWLCQFSRSMDPEAALARLQAADRNALGQVLDYLRRSGALVLAESCDASPADDEQASSRSRDHVRLLARSIYDAAADLFGLGPYAEAELSRRSGVGVERRLMALLAATDGLRSELASLRVSHLEGQLRALGIDSTSSELKLHIGCGKGLLAGWINIDIHPAPLSINVLRGLPFRTGSVRHIFVSHFLEHLFFPRDVKPFLAELRRVLAPGGIVRIVVPDIEQCIEAYTAKDQAFFASRRETWEWWPENPTRLEDFLAYAGAGAEPAYLFESHKYGYDDETLRRSLEDAGFVGIKRSSFMGSEHPELRVDEVSEVAGAKYGDRYYSLFVEALAPGEGAQ